MSLIETALGVPHITEGGIVTAKYYKAFNRTLQSMVERIRNLFYHLDFLYRFSTLHKKMKSSVAVMNNVSEAVSRDLKRAFNKYRVQYRVARSHGFNIFKRRIATTRKSKFQNYAVCVLQTSAGTLKTCIQVFLY